MRTALEIAALLASLAVLVGVPAAIVVWLIMPGVDNGGVPTIDVFWMN